MKIKSLTVITGLLLMALPLSCQEINTDQSLNYQSEKVLSPERLEKMFEKPAALSGYKPLQSGPLLRLDSVNGPVLDTTFLVEQMQIESEGLMINGWLYLPEKEGKYPLVVLTNGGGGDNRPIKSLSDFIAPVFAHCGIAAFVHDKRGTGKSEGIFRETTYEDYIRDAGNCAIHLSNDPRINPDLIGVMGGSEGGRIAVVAASRYPVFKFVISMNGTMVSMIDDRLNAQTGALRNHGYSDSLVQLARPLWRESFGAWASNDPQVHEKVNQKINKYRESFDRGLIPFTKEEMDTIPEFEDLLPTWNSLQYDYLTEMQQFNKKWLALFGAEDQVVPTEASVKNILHYMSVSGNEDYTIAIIPNCGHAPVDTKTGQRILFENIILNWMNENVLSD